MAFPNRASTLLKQLHPNVLSSLVIVTIFISISSCQSEKIDNSMLVEPEEGVSYARDIQPIFTTSCGGSGCHIGERTNGVELTNYQQTITSSGAQYGRLIVQPGNSADSPMIDKLGTRPQFGLRMPDGRAALSNDQIALIRGWIDEGAQDN